MASNNLIKKLKKEFLRNKAKSAVLGGMCLVAVYFWGPLIAGWIAPDSMSSDKKISVNELAAKTMATTTTASPAALPDRHEPRQRWNDILSWIDEDPAMKSASLGDKFADPFRSFDLPENMIEKDDETTEAPQIEIAKDITPEELGVKLDSTFVGRTNRAAKINGQRYLEDSVVTVKIADMKNFEEASQRLNIEDHLDFKLTEVHIKYVVLTRNGIEYALPLARADLGHEQRQVFERPQSFKRPSVVNN